MNREEMYSKLEDMNISGIGAICTDSAGNESYYFYEDFCENLGINKAMKELYALQDKGIIKNITFISFEDAKKLVRNRKYKFENHIAKKI